MTDSPTNPPPHSSLLADLPVRVKIPVAWGDLDALQHVNNTVYFRWFETVRAWRCSGESAGSGSGARTASGRFWRERAAYSDCRSASPTP